MDWDLMSKILGTYGFPTLAAAVMGIFLWFVYKDMKNLYSQSHQEQESVIKENTEMLAVVKELLEERRLDNGSENGKTPGDRG